MQPAITAFTDESPGRFKPETAFEHFERSLLGLQTDPQRRRIEPTALAAVVAAPTPGALPRCSSGITRASTLTYGPA